MKRSSLFAATVAVALAPLLAPLAAGPLAAQDEQVWHHATSLVGTPKYAEGFPHFDYVNPDAPKGGRVRFSDVGSFDSLNFVPPRGSTPLGLGLIYDSLMTSSDDEISTQYGLLAEAMTFPDDFSSVTYRLREGAMWHDGMPVTAEDVVWSFDTLVEHNPPQAFYYQHVEKAEVSGEREVTFTFDQTGNRELPQIVGQLIVMPRHWWESEGANGEPRDITRGTLEVPLGSGPYRIASVTAGRSIVYERVEDYWARDLNVNVGTNNFDEVRYEYFRDETVAFEAFKGDQVDWRSEATARVWANDYDFDAVKDGRVIRELFPQLYRTAGLMVGFIPNLRRAPFDDIRFREALNLAMPFEEMNDILFYEQYTRIDSYFDGIALESSGLPEGRELEILEGIRDFVPDTVFTEAYANPVNDNANKRNNLREAVRLLREAGYTLEDGKLLDSDGKPIVLEFLMNGPRFDAVGLMYAENLQRIGIELKLRPVDTSQYENRLRSRDFDMIYTGWSQSMSPGNEQFDFFGSEAAERDGSRNYGGISNEAVDELIRQIVQAEDRDELIALTHALDRVLLHNRYVIPGWTLRASRIAYWDRYSHPESLPEYAIGFPTIWWWDEEKAAALEAAE